ncbi:MAG TPA: hypothetical protein DHV48_10965 [Prolixibacteraceae bacterium]|nr:hypothetical protein [Prolixibacteraceae bacterium]
MNKQDSSRPEPVEKIFICLAPRFMEFSLLSHVKLAERPLKLLILKSEHPDNESIKFLTPDKRLLDSWKKLNESIVWL